MELPSLKLVVEEVEEYEEVCVIGSPLETQLAIENRSRDWMRWVYTGVLFCNQVAAGSYQVDGWLRRLAFRIDGQ